MRRHRVWLERADPGELRELSPDEAAHATRVLRRGPGDPVEILTADGRLFEGRLEEAGPGAIHVRVGEALPGSPALVPWTIAVARVKDRRFEDSLRAASELGLSGLLSLPCERSAVRGNPRRQGKDDRWQRLALESAKQCGRAPPLAIGEATSFLDALTTPDALWIAHPAGPGEAPARPDAHAPLEAYPVPDPGRPARILVGPEGGFSPGELSLAAERGARHLSLPTPILRTPTAVVLIAALALVLRNPPSTGVGPGSGGGAGPGRPSDE